MPTKKKQSILVAEDDRFYANIYETKLTKEGFEVEITNNGEEALAALKRKKPDLLLLDLVMPVKDGFAVLREMKDNRSLKSVKVIVMSNLGQEEDIKKAHDLGADSYLVKANISLSEMVDKVKEFLK